MSKKTIVLLFFLSFIFCFPLFLRIKNWGMSDFDQHLATAGAPRITILNYFQLPLWNPYHCGGMSEIANPQSKYLSPFFIFILIFGEPIGYKIIFFIHILIAIFGMYWLAKKYFLINELAAIFTSIGFTFSGIFIYPFSFGMTNFVNFSWVPILTFLFLKINSERNKEKKYLFIVACSIIISNSFFFGFHYFTLFFVYLLVLNLVFFIRSKNKKSFLGLFWIVLITYGLSAIKLLPSAELLIKNPRIVSNNQEGYSIQSLFFSLISRKQSIESWEQLGKNEIFYSWGIDENAMYVGIITIIFFIIGSLSSEKEKRWLFFPMIVFFWIILGSTVRLNLFSAIHSLPLLNYMRVAQRYKYFFLTFFMIIAGIGWQKLFDHKIFKKRANIIQVIILTIFFIDLFISNTSIVNKAFYNQPPNNTFRKNNFTQISIDDYYQEKFSINLQENNKYGINYNMSSQEYPLLLNNFGSGQNCYEPIPIPRHYVSSLGDNNYKGEIYFFNTKFPITYKYWSPNLMIVKIPMLGIDKDQIIINQNYDSGWMAIINKSKLKKVKNLDGLLAVEIDSLSEELTLIYLPISFLIGLLISLSTLSIIIYLYRNSQATLK